MWKKCAMLSMMLIGYAGMLSAANKIQLVLTVPRTVSTAFEKTMMARNDHKVFHEPFTVSWMYRTSNTSHMEGEPPQEILDAKEYEDVKALIYGYAENRPVFLKDMIHSCGADLLLDETLLSDPNVIITLLIRDPARSMESFFHKGLKSIPMEYMSNVIKMGYRYDLLMQIAEKHYALRGTWPIIIESEELCQSPEDTMKAFCAQAGLSFLAHALSWEQGMANEWKQTASWHDDAAHSRSFFVPKRDSQKVRFSSIPSAYVASLEEIYQGQKPFYEQLKALKATASRLVFAKEAQQYRVYDETTPEHVKNFYLANHTCQTLDFVLQKKKEYLSLEKKRMDIWKAVDLFDQLVDESDPDLDIPQLSWGHDEYLYHVVKDHVPQEVSYIIRYHSFYAAHHENGYAHLMNEQDKKMLPWLKIFSHYDLYSKSSEILDLHALMPYYQELVSEFFPEPLHW